MPRNEAAAPDHVYPDIRIHAIDIVQPPGIGIPPIADIDAHQTIAATALVAKRNAETPKKARPTVAIPWRSQPVDATRGPVGVVITLAVRERNRRNFVLPSPTSN
jgi:hypothetical protein